MILVEQRMGVASDRGVELLKVVEIKRPMVMQTTWLLLPNGGPYNRD